MKKTILSMLIVVAGSFAMAQQTFKKDTNRGNKSEMYEKHLEEMKKDLNLNETQVAEIKKLHESKMESFKQRKGEKEMKKGERKEMKSNKHSEEMKRILTPAQFEKWQAKRKEMKNERGEKMRNHRGKSLQKKGDRWNKSKDLNEAKSLKKTN